MTMARHNGGGGVLCLQSITDIRSLKTAVMSLQGEAEALRDLLEATRAALVQSQQQANAANALVSKLKQQHANGQSRLAARRQAKAQASEGDDGSGGEDEGEGTPGTSVGANAADGPNTNGLQEGEVC